MTNIINLPEYLVVEILSRIPAVSLARLRSTSKRWNALIRDGRFAKKHSANAPKQSVDIVVTNLRVYLLSVDLRGIHENVAPSVKVSAQFSLEGPQPDASEEVDIRDVFHCDGLLLCTTADNRLVVWNPCCSGETRWIPPKNSYKKSDIYALGKSSCNKYKILRVDRLNRYEYEIYDLTSDSWRCVGVITDRFWSGGIAMKGNTYWCVWPRESEGLLLLCFDYSTESFTSMSLPEDPDDSFAFSVLDLSVTREGQQLCLLSTFVHDTIQTNVWIATKNESTGVMSWSKFLTVERTDIIYRLQFTKGTSFLLDEENKVVLSCNGPSRFSKNIIHIMGEDKYIEVNHHGAKPTSPGSFLLSYVPSLVQIQQAI